MQIKNKVNCAPPLDIPSFQLTVTESCSHNRCSFCTMFKGIPFRMVPLEEIEYDLQEASSEAETIDRVFLAGGDAFVLPAERLLKIADLIHRYLPKVRTIAAYATVRNIMTKSDDELAALTQAGFGHINIGVEAGLPEVHAILVIKTDQSLRWLFYRQTDYPDTTRHRFR